MNLAQLVTENGLIRSDAPECPINLMLVTDSIYAPTYGPKKVGYYRPLQAQELAIKDFIAKHPGCGYGDISKGCKVGREKVNTVCHLLMRRSIVEGKGNVGKKRYWVKP